MFLPTKPPANSPMISLSLDEEFLLGIETRAARDEVSIETYLERLIMRGILLDYDHVPPQYQRPTGAQVEHSIDLLDRVIKQLRRRDPQLSMYLCNVGTTLQRFILATGMRDYSDVL